VIGPAVALLWWWLGDERPEAVVAFGIGWLSHPFADAVGSVLEWEFAGLAYFVWPLVEMPPPELEQSLLAHLLAFEPRPSVYVEFAAVAVALVVWRRDGCPGLATARERLAAVMLIPLDGR
jgi:hypothetical protein